MTCVSEIKFIYGAGRHVPSLLLALKPDLGATKCLLSLPAGSEKQHCCPFNTYFGINIDSYTWTDQDAAASNRLKPQKR